MAGGGLYEMTVLDDGGIAVWLLDADRVDAVLHGPDAADIHAHFESLADKAQRDAFAYGVIMALRYAQAGKGSVFA